MYVTAVSYDLGSHGWMDVLQFPLFSARFYDPKRLVHTLPIFLGEKPCTLFYLRQL